jgi:hypothetical protein
MIPETYEERAERLKEEQEIEDDAKKKRDIEQAMLDACEYKGAIYRCPECGGLFSGLIAIASYSDEKAKALCRECFDKKHSGY